jgi:hypothetical protein
LSSYLLVYEEGVGWQTPVLLACEEASSLFEYESGLFIGCRLGVFEYHIPGRPACPTTSIQDTVIMSEIVEFDEETLLVAGSTLQNSAATIAIVRPESPR